MCAVHFISLSVENVLFYWQRLVCFSLWCIVFSLLLQPTPIYRGLKALFHLGTYKTVSSLKKSTVSLG